MTKPNELTEIGNGVYRDGFGNQFSTTEPTSSAADRALSGGLGLNTVDRRPNDRGERKGLSQCEGGRNCGPKFV